MTMNEVIEYVDRVKPNAYSEDEKYKWIAQVEGLVSREVIGEEGTALQLPEDADKPLQVGAPYDGIYALYVMAQIDFHNREYNDYNNTALMFGELLDKYKAWYIRNNNPSKALNFRNVMG